MKPSDLPSWSASMLRRDLNLRAHHLATTQGYLHDLTTGSDPVVIFGRDEQGRHGNFYAASYARICANPAWSRRLAKVHTSSRQSRARKDWQWMELDSASSSDALLMNIFCHPGVFDGRTISTPVANLLNIDTATQPCFGITPGVPLKSIRKRPARKPHLNIALQISNTAGAPGLDSETWALESPSIPSPATPDRTLTDRTEIDLQLGHLFLEAKLTETSFQTAKPRLIEQYRDLETVFDITRLPWTPLGTVRGYQLIRNVLAAFASDASFCVLCDGRRRDLIEAWYSVLSAVHRTNFAWRLKLLTWQELAEALPNDLQHFLEQKYGIRDSPARTSHDEAVFR
jgi:hypothetical protein